MTQATRLRYISSPSPDGLEMALNKLPFKVEIKSIAFEKSKWYCWFVLPDTVSFKELEAGTKGERVNISSLDLEDF